MDNKFIIGAEKTPPETRAEVTKSFESFITKIENNIAFTTMVDDIGEKSYMEIPVEDLQKNGIECKPGIIFSFILRQRDNWEKVEFAPIQREPVTKKEMDDILNYYEEKYGE